LAYEKIGDWDTAIADFDKVIGLEEKSSSAYYDRACAYLGECDGSPKTSADLLEEADSSPLPRTVSLLEHALADLDKTIDFDDRNSDAYWDRAFVHKSLGEKQKAIADLDAVIKLNPQSAEAYCQKGMILLSLEDFASALASFDAAIERDPNRAAAYYGRGVVNLKNKIIPRRLPISPRRSASTQKTLLLTAPAETPTWRNPILPRPLQAMARPSGWTADMRRPIANGRCVTIGISNTTRRFPTPRPPIGSNQKMWSL
jgi:tetratricopeptide (TPR) repeat protein